MISLHERGSTLISVRSGWQDAQKMLQIKEEEKRETERFHIFLQMFWCLCLKHVWNSLEIASSCQDRNVKSEGRRERPGRCWKPCSSRNKLCVRHLCACCFLGYGHGSVIGDFSFFVQERQYQTPSGVSILKESRSLWKASWHLTAGQSRGQEVVSQRSGTEPRCGRRRKTGESPQSILSPSYCCLAFWEAGEQLLLSFLGEKVWLIDAATCGFHHEENSVLRYIFYVFPLALSGTFFFFVVTLNLALFNIFEILSYHTYQCIQITARADQNQNILTICKVILFACWFQKCFSLFCVRIWQFFLSMISSMLLNSPG